MDDVELSRLFATINQRLDRIEEHLGRVSRVSGLQYVPMDQAVHPEMPPEIVELAHSGHKIEAIKRYRELTSVDLAQAKDVIDSL
jgi:ribosomal protein L7/L12